MQQILSINKNSDRKNIEDLQKIINNKAFMVTENLIKDLCSTDWKIRKHAARVLKFSPSSIKNIVTKAFYETLDNNNEEISLDSAKILVSYGVINKKIISRIFEQRSFTNHLDFKTPETLSKVDQETIDYLISALDDEQHLVRCEAIKTLESIPNEPKIIDALYKIFCIEPTNLNEEILCCYATLALANLGESDDDIVESLYWILTYGRTDEKLRAAERLIDLNEISAEVIFICVEEIVRKSSFTTSIAEYATTILKKINALTCYSEILIDWASLLRHKNFSKEKLKKLEQQDNECIEICVSLFAIYNGEVSDISDIFINCLKSEDAHDRLLSVYILNKLNLSTPKIIKPLADTINTENDLGISDLIRVTLIKLGHYDHFSDTLEVVMEDLENGKICSYYLEALYNMGVKLIKDNKEEVYSSLLISKENKPTAEQIKIKEDEVLARNLQKLDHSKTEPQPILRFSIHKDEHLSAKELGEIEHQNKLDDLCEKLLALSKCSILQDTELAPIRTIMSLPYMNVHAQGKRGQTPFEIVAVYPEVIKNKLLEILIPKNVHKNKA